MLKKLILLVVPQSGNVTDLRFVQFRNIELHVVFVQTVGRTTVSNFVQPEKHDAPVVTEFCVLFGKYALTNEVHPLKAELIDPNVHPLGMVTVDSDVQPEKIVWIEIPEATVVGSVISCKFVQPENDRKVKLLIDVVGKLTVVNEVPAIVNDDGLKFSGNVNDCSALQFWKVKLIVHAKPDATVAGNHNHCIAAQPDQVDVKSIVPLVANEVILHQSRLLQFIKADDHAVHALREGNVILPNSTQVANALAIVVTEFSVGGRVTDCRFEQPEKALAIVVNPVMLLGRVIDCRLKQFRNALEISVTLDADVGITTV